VQLVVEPSEYVQVAMSWLVVPADIEVTPPVVAKVSELSPRVFGPLTVTTNGGVPATPPVIVALMVAVPMLTPLTKPELLTVATVVFELVHAVTALPWISVVEQLVVEPSEYLQ